MSKPVPSVPAPQVSAHRTAVALLQAMRPRQWTKNLFLFVGMVFTDNWHLLPRALSAFVLFCALSSGMYLLNDVRDRERDRVHPTKRNRPVASGALAVGAATAFGIVLIAGGLAGALLLGRRFAATALLFVALQVAYTYGLKNAVILDVFAIAMAFVLRAIAGAAAVGVPDSVWLLVCTLQLALFLGFGKRRHELVELEQEAGSHRDTLDHYSVPFLDQMISIVLGALVVSYAVYSVSSPTAASHPGMVFTLPFVLYGIFRYLYLIHIRRMGGSPEAVLLSDRPLQMALLLWLLCVVAAFKLR
ncbi:MAG: decaprenyl-phosphate phosphoribosyltransferase [Chthonomonadales bacterium]|nr:decaprenyl-phosphate phosphoribosyltransferase [Chthonomonadales bacterium]